MGTKKFWAASAALALTGVISTMPHVDAAAPSGTEVVTEADVTRQLEGTTPTDTWVLYTRAGTPPAAAGAFVDGPPGAPAGKGSLQLTTATGDEKVFLFNYDHVGTSLSQVDDISYYTNRQSGNLQQVAALNLEIDFNGAAEGGFSTLVFEPVYNADQGPVVSGTWQDWVADGAGVWWSTRAINGQCARAIENCFRTWDQIVANNPDATILGGVGVNQGSGNPGLVTAVDKFSFDATTYDFERIRDLDGDGVADTAPPTSKDECKKDGYTKFNNPTFKSQGDCVSYAQTRP